MLIPFRLLRSLCEARAFRCVAALVLALSASGIFAPAPAAAQEKTCRIAYLEAGPFWLYAKTLAAFKAALNGPQGCRILYPEDLHVSLGWRGSPQDLEGQARRLFAAGPDLILAAGTDAVRALLAVNDGRTPILGLALADPLAAGFMKAPAQSVAPNFTCEVVPDRWKNMYRVFHDVIGFKKLGVMYPAGPTGKVYGGVDDALAVAQEASFSVLEAVIPDESAAACRKGIEDLHQRGADAFFIGPLNCFDWSSADPTPLLDLLISYDMPTFARDGSIFVQGGALMGFSTWDFSPTGRRLAQAAMRILSGTPPAQVHLTGTSEPLIALNLETARKLGFNLPFDVLVVADEIYATTSKPDLR